MEAFLGFASQSQAIITKDTDFSPIAVECCQTRNYKQWSPICLKKINNWTCKESSILKQTKPQSDYLKDL
jgi:hypothetical protein